MTITRKTVKRIITESEFLRMKKLEPFFSLRQDSKAISFGFLFGSSYKKFSSTSLEPKWDITRVDAYIKENKLEANIPIMTDKHPDIEPILWKYYVVAQDIRTTFFNTYKGLMERIKRNEVLGKTQGYIRSYHGCIRRVPLLSLSTTGDGRWRKGDSMKEMAGLVNICANTDIQSLEICILALAMTQWNKLYNDKAMMIGTVHDSVDFVMNRDGATTTIELIREVFEHEEDWQLGVKFLIEFVIADMDNEEVDHYYKHGYSYEKFIDKFGG